MNRLERKDITTLLREENGETAEQRKSGAYRLRRSASQELMPVGLVSAFAGDRGMTKAEDAVIQEQKSERGATLYSDLLYTISHHYFAPSIAEDLWSKILAHKHEMSEQLCRNVRITVATLDYLSNITSELMSPTLISEDYAEEITSLSMRDGMTGLFNHSSCYELLDLEFSSHHRYGAGVSIILLDIDDFKQVNDLHGHQEGDRVLVELARVMKAQVRESDICCRFGGEEFIAILPFTGDPDTAHHIAERIREHAMSITSGGNRITISSGVASCDHLTTSSEALIAKADHALYQAKKRGKNRVVIGLAQEI